MPPRRRRLGENDYLTMLLRLMPRTQIEAWLAQNEPPPWRQAKPYEYAYTEMVVSERYVFRTVRNG